jgi:hypothetical protein
VKARPSCWYKLEAEILKERKRERLTGIYGLERALKVKSTTNQHHIASHRIVSYRPFLLVRNKKLPENQ